MKNRRIGQRTIKCRALQPNSHQSLLELLAGCIRRNLHDSAEVPSHNRIFAARRSPPVVNPRGYPAALDDGETRFLWWPVLLKYEAICPSCQITLQGPH